MNEVTLEDLPPGSLFIYQDTIGFKSEYHTNGGAVEAYIVGSGEFFWAGAETSAEQCLLRVKPIDDDAIRRLIQPPNVGIDKRRRRKHINFELTTPMGRQVRIKGNPQMADQTKAALGHLMDLVYQHYSEATVDNEYSDEYQEILSALTKLQLAKPDDRSELARRYAICITEMEKVQAYFWTFIEQGRQST